MNKSLQRKRLPSWIDAQLAQLTKARFEPMRRRHEKPSRSFLRLPANLDRHCLVMVDDDLVCKYHKDNAFLFTVFPANNLVFKVGRSSDSSGAEDDATCCWAADLSKAKTLYDGVVFENFAGSDFDRPEPPEEACFSNAAARPVARDRRHSEKAPKPWLIEQFKVGPTVYRLAKVEVATVTTQRDGTAQFEVTGLSPTFVGRGDSKKDARRNFHTNVHSRFQLLSRMRPFQMNEQEATEWGVLERHIDVAYYWSKTPLKTIETGFLKEIDPNGYRVFAWIDGQRSERLSLDELQPEFAALKIGEWFEALAVREPGNYELREITFIQTIAQPAKISDRELTDWMNQLPNRDLTPAKDSWESI